jgi:glucose-6-phosphate isomerase
MLRLEYGRMLQEGLDGEHGLTRAQLAELVRRFPGIQSEVRARRAAGEYGFYDLAEQGSAIRSITQFASGVGQAFDHVLVLGIGGSALGARALLTALRAPAWNELDDEGRDFYPRLTILDNVDPLSVHAALGRIDPRRVLVNVVSKSGSTAETMAQYLVVRAWLEDALGPAATRHLVFTTDPERGVLREIARREGIAAVDIPPAVGGRFSVLSPVGVLPAALVGVDIAALLGGAERALRDAESPDLLANRPALHAALHWAADTWQGARIDVLMPYCDRLRDLAAWYRPLWAESLGKRFDRRGAEVFTGPTPLAAVGATDQHSQVQLFMEGPFDKVLTLVSVEDPAVGDPIPSGPELPAELAYLPGRSLNELLAAECRATSGALASSGRMHTVLRLPEISEDSLGELLMFYQLATGFAGAWYGVNPFDQPGVELGKQLTCAAVGRPGSGGTTQPPADPGDFA